MTLKNLLIYRLGIFNVLVLCGLIYAGYMGYVDILLKHDELGIIYFIAGLAGLGITGAFIRGWKVSTALNDVKAQKYVDPVDVHKMPHKNEYLRDMAGWSVLMGLFGNTWGLLTALSGGSTDALLQGAGVAFGSTVAGILAAFVLEVNFSMIRTATGTLAEEVKSR